MAAAVAEALRALADGDAAPLARVVAQHKLQRRPALAKKKAKTATKKKNGARQGKEGEDAAAASENDDEGEGGGVGEELRALPAAALDAFYPAAERAIAGEDEEDEEHKRRYLLGLAAVAEFATLLVETKDVAIDKNRVFKVAQQLHDRLLRLRGQKEQTQAAQEAIALLCEVCWKNNFCGMAHSLVTQLLPYLIVRAYESPATGSFNAKKHHVRRLFAIKDALLLLDFDDESSGYVASLLYAATLK